MSLDTVISTEARDLLPETWDALSQADTFGDAALSRRHDRVVRKIFGGVEMTKEELDVLPDAVIEFVGKRLAIALIDPAIDYWSKQVLSHTAGERETKAYKDRVEDLKELRKQWIADTAALFLDIEDLLPMQVRRAQDAPRVIDAGDNLTHVTPNPMDIEPLAGELDTTATTGA